MFQKKPIVTFTTVQILKTAVLLNCDQIMAVLI